MWLLIRDVGDGERYALAETIDGLRQPMLETWRDLVSIYNELDEPRGFFIRTPLPDGRAQEVDTFEIIALTMLTFQAMVDHGCAESFLVSVREIHPYTNDGFGHWAEL